MTWRHWLYSNIFFRNVLSTLGIRSRRPEGAGEVEPFFQFKIAPYHNDLYLYFPKKPFPLRYKNEIFNKLEEYSGHDVTQYLEFHFNLYPDNRKFLQFVQYEVSERLKQTPRKLGLQAAQDWIDEKKAEISNTQKLLSLNSGKFYNQEISPDERSETQENINMFLGKFHQKFEDGFHELLQKAETSMAGLASSYTTGRIELDSRSHEEKLIQLFILIQQIKAPGKGEQLFRKISSTDIAGILHLHFAAFQDNKLTTVQRKVSEQTDRIRPDQVKIRRLTDALQDFFY